MYQTHFTFMQSYFVGRRQKLFTSLSIILWIQNHSHVCEMSCFIVFFRCIFFSNVSNFWAAFWIFSEKGTNLRISKIYTSSKLSILHPPCIYILQALTCPLVSLDFIVVLFEQFAHVDFKLKGLTDLEKEGMFLIHKLCFDAPCFAIDKTDHAKLLNL